MKRDDGKLELVSRKGNKLLRRILDALEDKKIYVLYIPGDIVDRTELLCMYISEQLGEDVKISTIIMLLYIEFLHYSVTNPNLSRVLKEVTNKYVEPPVEYIKIVCDGKVSYEKPEDTRLKRNKIMKVKMDRSEAKKGEIILDELYYSLGVKVSMEELLSSLWINFISDYREGKNKRAYRSVLKLLKEANL